MSRNKIHQIGSNAGTEKLLQENNELLKEQNENLKNQMKSNRKRANLSLVLSIIAVACSLGILIFNWLNYSK